MHAADIARICHEANRALQLAHTRDSDTGIPVPPHWDELATDEQTPVLAVVGHAQHGATPEQLHNSWCDARRRDGWTFGDVEDPAAKTHPRLVPYEMLTDQQQVNAAVFGAIVGALTT